MLQHRPLFVRVEHQRAHTTENRTENRQPHGRIALRRRDQHCPGRDSPHAVEGVVVAVAEDDDPIESGLLGDQRADEGRAGRALAVEPRQFVLHGVHPVEDEC